MSQRWSSGYSPRNVLDQQRWISSQLFTAILILGVLASLFKSRARLEAENPVLRQQVNVLRMPPFAGNPLRDSNVRRNPLASELLSEFIDERS